MYIIYENENNIEELRSKYLVLELDTIEIEPQKFIKSFCVIDSEHIDLNEVQHIPEKLALHNELLSNYKLRKWGECYTNIEQLAGSFKGEVDSFYEVLYERITRLSNVDLIDTWTGAIKPQPTNQ